MASANTGVYPCYENQFQIGDHGAETADKQIANCEEFTPSFDNGVDEWKPFDQQGWTARALTGKSVTISVKGKRTKGDPGNDLVASLAFLSGRDVECPFQWTFPDGTKVLFPNAIISVTACGSGQSTSVGPLEFEVMSNGKPIVTLAEPAV